jgi:exportin-1
VILRDFLISLKEFSGDNTELFAEERAMKIGGLLKPSEMDDDEL